MSNPYILITDHCIIGLPSLCKQSKDTLDIKFFDLATDYELQEKMMLASRTYIQQGSKERDSSITGYTIRAVARFLSCFKKTLADKRRFTNC